jgi:uncharacterized protein (DUF362 family)
MNSFVSLVRVQNSDLGQSISKALDLASFKFPSGVKSVVIKPNLCYYWDAATGYTTDPCVVAAIIDRVREEYGKDVAIKVAEADASAMRTKYAFKVLGYEKMVQDKKVELFNLSEGELEEKTVRVNNHQLQFKVNPLLLNADLFINVPKPKLMKIVKITCAMKNIFGCIGTPRKVIYHKHLNEAVVGINKVLRPHLTIVDGLTALGRFPAKLNLLMAGTSPFSVDWVVSQMMGYNPSKVQFLKLSVAENIENPRNVVTRGENVAEFARIIPKEKFIPTSFLWYLQFKMLGAYQKITGDIIPPFIQE